MRTNPSATKGKRKTASRSLSIVFQLGSTEKVVSSVGVAVAAAAAAAAAAASEVTRASPLFPPLTVLTPFSPLLSSHEQSPSLLPAVAVDAESPSHESVGVPGACLRLQSTEAEALTLRGTPIALDGATCRSAPADDGDSGGECATGSAGEMRSDDSEGMRSLLACLYSATEMNGFICVVVGGVGWRGSNQMDGSFDSMAPPPHPHPHHTSNEYSQGGEMYKLV